jgi:WS/DGAT/MGAT family acyltransferase
MSGVDAAWLRMDRPTNLMIVNTVMWFDEPVGRAEVRALVQERLITRFPRFSQRVVTHRGSYYWVDDRYFDLDAHLVHAALPSPGGRKELHDYVSRLWHVPLNRERPLWELHLVDNFGGGTALVSRIHHCVADGIALSRVMLSLTDDPREADHAGVASQPRRERQTPFPGLPTLPDLRGLGGALAGAALHPKRALGLSRATLRGSRALAKLLALPPDARTPLRGSVGIEKRASWSEPFPLQRVKDAARVGGVTVNDLLLGAVTGALREHLIRRDAPVEDVRAVVPFNLRPLDQPLPAELGNRFGLVFLPLPLSVPDPAGRLHELHRRMEAIKASPEGAVAFGILDLVGRGPARLEQLVVEIFGLKGTAVVTNVRGPGTAVRLAGRRVAGTIGWPPESAGIGLGVSIISYADEVTIGVVADRRRVPDADALLADLLDQLELLVHLYSPPHRPRRTTRAAPGRRAAARHGPAESGTRRRAT